MSGGGGGGGGGKGKADMFLVELRNGETVLVDGGSISSPVAKVCTCVVRKLVVELLM